MIRRSVRVGIDVLIGDASAIAGRRIGLITNPSGVTGAGLPSWKALLHTPETRLVRLFGPEHGVDGGAVYMEAVGDAIHGPTGLPVVSLYGATAESLAPLPEHLADLDALVFDVADVGARYYTFMWTMLLAMEAAARARVRFVVCDRPNPIGGIVEGAAQDPDLLSFVGMHPIAVRHGMTAGELAGLLAAEKALDLDLVVSPVSGWARTDEFPESLYWVSPSPNIPSPATALLYPGMCLLEGTNVSEGRGTTRPFELFGAPWMNAVPLARELQALELPGAAFVPAHFRPMYDKYAGQTCAGALLRVTDRRAFRALETGMRVVEAARRLYPGEFRWRSEPYEFDPRPAIDLLTGSPRFRRIVEQGSDLGPENARQSEGAAAFLRRREPHLLYRDRRPSAVAFVGPHDAGKTTLLVDLVPALAALGLSIGTIKHTGRDVDDDLPGKDSQRHAASGASVAALVTPARTTSRRFGGEEPLEDLLAREFSGCDLVLIEGYKSLPVPKIEVRRRGSPALSIPGVSARVSDEPPSGGHSSDGVLTLGFGEREPLVEIVLRLAGLARRFARA